MSASSESDIQAALAPIAGAFASEHAQRQFAALNKDLAEVSPSLLPELIKARLMTPEHQHFLKPAQPKYMPGSLDEFEANYFARGNQAPGLRGANTSGMTSRLTLTETRQTRPPATLDQIEAAHAQQLAQIGRTGIGLGAQHIRQK